MLAPTTPKVFGQRVREAWKIIFLRDVPRRRHARAKAMRAADSIEVEVGEVQDRDLAPRIGHAADAITPTVARAIRGTRHLVVRVSVAPRLEQIGAYFIARFKVAVVSSPVVPSGPLGPRSAGT